MSRTLLASLALLCASTSAYGQDSSFGNLDRRVIERRAVEAVIWGIPAVNTQLMLQEMLTKTKGQVNQILYWSRPADSRNQTLTPNPDSIYFMSFYNTKEAGPVVFDVPPADTGSIAGNIVNVWQMPLEDAGPEGADKGRGGKYLILPPGYKGKPPAGYIVLQSDTYTGYVVLRSNLVSHSDADIAKAVAYGKRAKVYSLSHAANPPPTMFADASGTLFDSTIRYDLSFFQLLDRVIQSEPWLQRDRAMIDQLKSIGIEKGKPFNPDAKMEQILRAAIREAQTWLEQRYDQGFPPFWPGSRWGLPAPLEMVKAQQTSYGDPNSYPIDARAVAYMYAFIGIKRLGTAQFHLMTIKDKAGEPLDGANTYRLTVPPDVPVTQYWSATAYDRAKHTILNTPKASRSSQIPDLQKNDDGSIDIYFGPNVPAGKEANWVPTVAGRHFEVMFRFYGPTKLLFEKTWKLPDIEEVK